MSTRTKYVCFTVNNYTASDYAAIKKLGEDKCTYMVIGKEIGESGTPHLQGYLETKSRSRLSQVTKWINDACGRPGACHTESRIGSAAQAAEYCMKEDDDFFEFGEISKPGKKGKRTDIEKVRDDILSGVIRSEWDLLNKVTSMQAYRFGSVFINNMPVDPSREPPLIFWLYGATGTGKSRAAAEFIRNVVDTRGWQYWRANQGLNWFDGYHQQEIAWFDDFRHSGKKTDYSLLLNITDRYPLRVPIKGGFVPWNPKIIIFTGPKSIETSFPELTEGDGVDQFIRRVTSQHHFGNGGEAIFAEKIHRFLSTSESQAPAREDPGVIKFDPDGPYITDDAESDYDTDDMIVDSLSDDDDYNYTVHGANEFKE